jgi:hypothetical protein
MRVKGSHTPKGIPLYSKGRLSVHTHEISEIIEIPYAITNIQGDKIIVDRR